MALQAPVRGLLPGPPARVLVAMSGGVDSSVTAALLHAAGYAVVGVTLRLNDHDAPARAGACCAGQDARDARRVADTLGFPHYVVDATARFARAVIGDFADTYAQGRTPVPCIRCNQSVKFTDLSALAADLGCAFLATGHYARRVDGPDGPELHRAADAARDQSWFLFATTADQLARVAFPLGDCVDKAAVRAEADRLGLAVAHKPDSQDLCFVPRGSYAEIVGKLRPDAMAPGAIVDRDGRAWGTHDGIARYTVGQARRLGPVPEGHVVIAIDAPARRIVIGPRAAAVTEVRITEANWLIAPPTAPLRVLAKLRGRDVFHPASVVATDAGAMVTLDAPALPAPGQACVLYDGTRVLGGGFIVAPASAPMATAAAPVIDRTVGGCVEAAAGVAA